MLRFVPLYFLLIYSIAFAAVICLVVYADVRKIFLLKFAIFGGIFLPICHWVVVSEAATDNIVELMKGGGSWLTSLLFWLCLMVFTLTASQLALLATRIRKRALGFSLASLVCSFPVAFLFLHYATEHNIVKYGKEFSALQFLLSPDRESYVQLPGLLMRYGIAHAGIVFLIAFVQVTFWIWIMDRERGDAIHSAAASET
jgi:hypothetical protein